MTEFCFDVLGIAPTEDETIIKKAYRKLLHSVNPEDDMQGFQRLRRAYEEACRYAKKKEGTQKKSASEQFMDRCRELYHSFFRRIRPEEWEELFEEPVCVNLDTEEEVRKAFLSFLMEHFHFPAEVWKCIDRTFDISGDRKALTEWFPEDFVDYLCQAAQDEGIINYELFEKRRNRGAEGSKEKAEQKSAEDAVQNIAKESPQNLPAKEFDDYIDVYYRLRQFTDLGLMEQAAADLETIKTFSVYHPYEEIEEARILLYEEKKEEAGEIFIRMGKTYPHEERIACCYGQFLQMEERWEELRGIYDGLLADNPESVSARSGKAEELIHDGAYREAREIILDLLEYSPQDERLMKDLADANVFMIEELESLWKEGRLDQDGWLDLGWCYYQNMRFEDALAVLDARVPDEEHLLDYHNLKGRVYLTMDKNEEALVHLVPWLDEVLKLEPDGTKKTERRLARLGYAYYTIGSARVAILLRLKNDERETFLDEEKYKNLFPEANGFEDAFAATMEYFDKAIAAETEESQIVSYYHTVADIWRQQKEYGKAVDACDHILMLNQGYYPAILLRQEACLYLGMYQEVAEDYQRAVHMYPYYGRPYATLIKMYFMFGEYEKVRDILELTEKNKIESDALQILTARYRAVTAGSREDLEVALDILNALKKKGWSYASDVEQNEWNEVEYRRGLILTDLGRLREAREALEASMADGEEDVPKLFGYAAVLMQSEEYDLAIAYLKKALAYVPDDEGILYRLGWCYKLKGKYESALSYFEKAREKNPESIIACNNAGNCYLSMNMPEKAEALFLEAVRLMKNEITPLPYNNLARCYRIMGEYEAALMCYKNNMKLFPDSTDMYLLLGDFYRENEEYGKAIATYEEGMSKTTHPMPLEMEMLRTYGMKGNYAMVTSLMQRLRKKYPEDAVLCQLAGEVYLFGLEKGAEAALWLEKALRLCGKENDMECVRGSLYLLGRCRLFLGEREEAERCFRKYLEVCRGKDGRSRKYEEFYGERGRRKFRIGCVLLLLGDDGEAERCFREMRTEKYRCDGCSRACCYEKMLGDALMLLAKGERSQAVQKYKEAAEQVPDDMEHRFEYKQMKKWEESP